MISFYEFECQYFCEHVQSCFFAVLFAQSSVASCLNSGKLYDYSGKYVDLKQQVLLATDLGDIPAIGQVRGFGSVKVASPSKL